MEVTLSNDDFASLWDWQGGFCGICGRPFTKSRRAAIDHDHRTGEIRGLLCAGWCNRLIGYLQEDVRWLKNAAAYLEQPGSRECWVEEPRWWPGSPGAAGHDLREGTP